MNELSSPPTDLEITPEDWQQTPASAQALLLRLHTQVGALTQEVAQLREQLDRNSRNSSQPPSSDPPAQKAPQKRATSTTKGRKRGGQPGHKGHHRLLIPSEQVNQVVVCKPNHCGDCGRALVGDDSAPYRYQTVEIPTAQKDVTEFQVHRLPCPDCGAETRGSLPAEAAASQFGVNLSTWLVLLMGVYRLSKRQVVDLLALTYGVHLSPGTVVNIQNRASQALAPLVEEAYEAVKTQPARYIDDTSWQQGDIERKSYLWVVVTPLLTVFHIVASRAGQVARDLLDEESTGATISDRASSFSWLKGRVWQVCWAHLRRDFQKILERGGASFAIGETLRIQADYLLMCWGRVRDGTLSHEAFLSELPTIQNAVHQALCAGSQCEHPKTAATCRRLLAVEDALWTFATHPDVEPTNNAAERALRPAVIWRKTSYGTQSEAGSRFVERILTVVTSARQQGRNPFELVRDAIQAQRSGTAPPSLL
jgi:transposase